MPVRKDKALIEILSRFSRKLLGGLCCLYAAEDCHCVAVERYLPAPPRFRAFKDDGDSTGCAFGLLCPRRCQRRTNRQGASIKIDRFAFQGDKLTPTGPSQG